MQRLSHFLIILLLGSLVVHPADCMGQTKPALNPPPGQWRALHLLHYQSDAALEELAGQIPVLADMGINVLILEVNYGFEYQ